jgi:hypothetical protein
MRRFNLAFALASFVFATPAFSQGATLALPGVVFTAPGSTSIGCTETAAANLVVPVAQGATIFSCIVQPSSWTGAVSISNVNGPFTVQPPVGNTFLVVTSAAVSAPVSYPTPGSVSTLP